MITMKNFLIISAFCLINVYVVLLREFDMSHMLVYYQPRSRLPLRITSIQNSLSHSSTMAQQSSTKLAGLLKVGFRSNGCTCQELSCGCCAGFNFQQLNFNREGCMNFTYDPYEFAINMEMFMNDESIFSGAVSAKNPPPLCIPVPVSYLPTIDFCVRLFNIHTPGQNLFMCLDFETRIEKATILILHFNCMRMGVDGVDLEKPKGKWRKRSRDYGSPSEFRQLS